MTISRKILWSIRQWVLFMALYSIMSSATAQISMDRDDQQWTQYINITTLPPKWIIHTIASLRWRETFRRSSDYLIRSGIGLQINDHFRFVSGVGYFKPINSSSSNFHEIRPYQEAFFRHDLGKTGMINRFQVEERVLRKIEIDQQQPMYFRFRYALFFSIPLADLSKDENRKDLNLAVRNEIFINGPNLHGEKFFDQERVSIGPTLAMNHLTLFVLWHNQIATLPNKGDYRFTSILALQILHRLDL